VLVGVVIVAEVLYLDVVDLHMVCFKIHLLHIDYRFWPHL
jgi:hypothetical protein